MKRLIIFFALIFSFSGCNMFSNKTNKNTDIKKELKPVIEFSNRVINVGTLSNDTIIKVSYNIKNIGGAVLKILDINPECSCTEFELGSDVVLPGASIDLLVNFNTKGKAQGLQRIAILLESNSDIEFSTLFIQCIIK